MSNLLKAIKGFLMKPINQLKYFLNSNFPLSTVKLIYFIKFKKFPNLSKPKLFSEKLVWLRFYYPNVKDVVLAADKAGIHQFLSNRKLEKLAIPLVGIYSDTSEINWETLPQQFVIKKSNGCGMNIIVKNKNDVSKKAVLGQIDKWMTIDYGKIAAEPHYSKAPSKIVIEKFIEGIDNDWKLFYINGKPKMLQITKWLEPDEGNLVGKRDYILLFTNLEGEILAHKMADNSRNTNKDFAIGAKIDLPSDFSEMIEYGNTLSKDFPMVRVDFFHYEGKILLGEMTFTPSGGVNKYNQEIQVWLGNELVLPNKILREECYGI